MALPPVTTGKLSIPSNPEAPIRLEIALFAITMVLFSRDHLKLLDEDEWQTTGVYVLAGRLAPPAKTDVYVGKSGGGQQGLKGRLHRHANNKAQPFPWKRGIAIRRNTADGWTSSEAAYLEGRLIAELRSLKDVNVKNKKNDAEHSLPDYDEANLDVLVPYILSCLRLLGISSPDRAVDVEEEPEAEGAPAVPKPKKKPKKPKKKPKKKLSKVGIGDLLAAGVLTPGQVLVYERHGESRNATIVADGSLLVDGTAYGSPSAAAKAAYDLKSAPGWDCWKLKAGNAETLNDVRRRFENDAPGS